MAHGPQSLNSKSSILNSRALNPRFGFTLIEVLVVAVMTLWLTTIAILGFNRGSREAAALTVEGAKVAELILKAKGQAISTYNIPPIPCGYGLQVKPPAKEYALVFYDVPADDPKCTMIKTEPLDVARIRPFKETSGFEQRFTLTSGVTFPGGPQQLSYLLFVPPDPKTYLFTDPAGGVPLTSGKGYVYLATEEGGDRFTVAVSVVGQITFPP